MKLNLSFYLILVLLWMTYNLQGQTHKNGKGKNVDNNTTCLSSETRAQIFKLINQNRKKLNLQTSNKTAKSVVNDLIFPLAMPTTIPGFYNFHAVSAYVDHDSSNGYQDYNCLGNSYNNHKGSDFFTFPFPWYLYENDLVEVVSAAAGTIILKQDGNEDTNCEPVGDWNAVYVQQADGSTIWYGHLKSGKLTSKAVGDTVEKGEYLGVVASSGRSTDAHLHLEYYDENDKLLDPFQGECNTLNENSLWEEQPNHVNPKINALLTHSVLPNIACGPENEVAELSNVFQPGEEIFLGVYITDYIAGDTAITRILKPDNTVYDSFTTFNTEFSYEWFWNAVVFTLADSVLNGTWKAECKYLDKTYTHTFEFINPMSAIENLNEEIKIFPNPATNNITITGIQLANKKYQIINLSGQIAKQGILNSNEILLDEVECGLYYLEFKDSKKAIQKKIIKY